MRLKKFLILFFILVILSSTFSVYAEEATDSTESKGSDYVEFDISKLAENINKHPYLPELQSVGVSVSAVQTGSTVILKYNNQETLIYNYDQSTGFYSCLYPYVNKEKYETLNAIFIDTISIMQGNAPGLQIPFVFDDSFFYTSTRYTGIEKMHSTDANGNGVLKFMVNPNVKMITLNSMKYFEQHSFLEDPKKLFSKEVCVFKISNLILCKTYSEDGKLVVYLGEPVGISDEFSYNSLKSFLAVYFKDHEDGSLRAVTYFENNLETLIIGNLTFEDSVSFNGVTVEEVKELPIHTADTVLLAPNMKYLKFTIDEDVVKEELPNVNIEKPLNEETAVAAENASKSRLSAPLVISSVIIGSVVLIMLAGILIRRNQDLDE